MGEKSPRILFQLLWCGAALAGGGACGDDPSGPDGVDYSGTYPGEFYVIVSSTVPEARISDADAHLV
jgi:hypothetical protein